jgi:hypothetical protein
VFTARYALSPYIKQIRFVFKGLNSIHSSFTTSPRADHILCHTPLLIRPPILEANSSETYGFLWKGKLAYSTPSNSVTGVLVVFQRPHIESAGGVREERLNCWRGVDETEERCGQGKRGPVTRLSRQICITCPVPYAMVPKIDNLLNI